MFGFRLLAIILGLLCLAAAVLMAYPECPRVAPLNEFFIRHFVPDPGVEAFIRSADPGEARIKNLIRYTLAGMAVCSLGLGLLFFCAAVNPLRMRPFVSVVMLCAAIGTVVAIWQGVRLGIFKSWWIGDAAGGLLLLILLAALYPKPRKTAPARLPGEESEAELD